MNKKEISQAQLLQALSQSEYTRTNFISEQTQENLEDLRKKGKTTKFTRKFVRQIAKKAMGYNFGNLGASNVAGIPSRKERRAVAKRLGVSFKPVYNN